MGTYLSSPIIEKGTEQGECLDDSITPVVWGVVDMQGWRKSMEDTHVAQTNVELPKGSTHAKVFGVFDGHGGPEVARFCQLYLVNVLTHTWNIEEGEESGEDSNKDEISPVVSRALIRAFHTLDRMIADIERRDELIRLRTYKPKPSERRTTDSIPPPLFAVCQDVIESEKSKDHQSENDAEPTAMSTPNELPPGDPPPTPCLGATSDDTTDEDSHLAVGIENVEAKSNKIAVEPDPAAPFQASPSLGMVATIIQNGRQMCNLPDHAIHAGCAAIVAVVIDRTLTIANAGDSRAVLCRSDGRAEALSLDHKPHLDREIHRIVKAGGFVNQFGRVNGNLNLSRSIGDLKYKQIPGLSPAEQMITAEPDIVQVTLDPKDEFLLLGCDGIWDCLSNKDAVSYVRERIDSKTPTEIGIELLDFIISEDPRATQGIGGDNMTLMIIDLQPNSRSYR